MLQELKIELETYKVCDTVKSQVRPMSSERRWVPGLGGKEERAVGRQQQDRGLKLGVTWKAGGPAGGGSFFLSLWGPSCQALCLGLTYSAALRPHKEGAVTLPTEAPRDKDTCHTVPCGPSLCEVAVGRSCPPQSHCPRLTPPSSPAPLMPHISGDLSLPQFDPLSFQITAF